MKISEAMKTFGATDNLDLMFKMQEAFQSRVDSRCFSSNLEVRADFIRDHVNYMNNEVAEMLQEMPYFKHWKNYDKMTGSEREAAYVTMKKEYVDVLHFFINLGVALGFNGNELTEMYVQKNEENIRRQNEGYDHTMKHLEADSTDKVVVHSNGTVSEYKDFIAIGFKYKEDGSLDGAAIKTSELSVAELIVASNIIEQQMVEATQTTNDVMLAAAISAALDLKKK